MGNDGFGVKCNIKGSSNSRRIDELIEKLEDEYLVDVNSFGYFTCGRGSVVEYDLDQKI